MAELILIGAAFVATLCVVCVLGALITKPSQELTPHNQNNPSNQQNIAKERVNCITCGTGKSWWIVRYNGTFWCHVCGGDPLVAGSGNPNWRAEKRRKMVQQFGPRLPGD
jgi:hypothetical protein